MRAMLNAHTARFPETAHAALRSSLLAGSEQSTCSYATLCASSSWKSCCWLLAVMALPAVAEKYLRESAWGGARVMGGGGGRDAIRRLLGNAHNCRGHGCSPARGLCVCAREMPRR